MSTDWLAPNVATYEPDAVPARIDSAALRERGWSPDIIEYIQRGESALANLRMSAHREPEQGDAAASPADAER